MIEVKFNGFIDGESIREEIHGSKGWAEWRILDLSDIRGLNPEWFKVAACNKYYYDQVISNKSDEKKGYIIQDTFDEGRLKEVIADRFREMLFKDWEDFYSQMSEKFIYED